MAAALQQANTDTCSDGERGDGGRGNGGAVRNDCANCFVSDGEGEGCE